MADKTETPTPRRLAEARERGHIAKSVEVNTALVLLAAFWLLRGAAARTAEALRALMQNTLAHLPGRDLSPAALSSLGLDAAWQTALAAGPFILGLAAVGLAANLAQTGGLVVPGLAAPNLQRLNPLAGIQRLFSRHGLAEVGKAFLKVLIVGGVVYATLTGQAPRLLTLANMDLRDALAVLANLIFGLGARAALAYGLLAIVDYAYQRRQWLNALRMTRHELLEEIKRSEGDPLLRQRIRQQQRRLARRRMMERVPKANVVITNPTHLAVALRYDRARMSAPRVVAKGAFLIAERIVEVARAHGVPVIQNVALARALYSGVQIDQEIPPALYHAVAEVLAFVFSLKRRSVVSGLVDSLMTTSTASPNPNH